MIRNTIATENLSSSGTHFLHAYLLTFSMDDAAAACITDPYCLAGHYLRPPTRVPGKTNDKNSRRLKNVELWGVKNIFGHLGWSKYSSDFFEFSKLLFPLLHIHHFLLVRFVASVINGLSTYIRRQNTFFCTLMKSNMKSCLPQHPVGLKNGFRRD